MCYTLAGRENHVRGLVAYGFFEELETKILDDEDKFTDKFLCTAVHRASCVYQEYWLHPKIARWIMRVHFGIANLWDAIPALSPMIPSRVLATVDDDKVIGAYQGVVDYVLHEDMPDGLFTDMLRLHLGLPAISYAPRHWHGRSIAFMIRHHFDLDTRSSPEDHPEPLPTWITAFFEKPHDSFKRPEPKIRY
jgi:hypothetical protein